MKVDQSQLAVAVADGLRLVAVELEPIDVVCAWPVFRATSVGCAPIFVKVTDPDAANRTLTFLSGAGDVPFLPKPLCPAPIPFNGFGVLCLEWKGSERVNAEDMTAEQLDGFAEGCRRLSGAFADYRGDVTPLSEEESPRGQYDKLQRYALRHPLAGRLLKPLLSIPESERSYGNRPLVTIHGDLQPRNYGFDGNRFAAVYDTDDLTEGLACEDACYAFAERARRSELSAAARQRLTDLFLRLVAKSPWPGDEWLIAISHARLRIAARRLEKHPDSAFVAFDIARRDKPLRALAVALKEESC